MTHRRTRRSVLAAFGGGLTAVAGCLGTGTAGSDDETATATTTSPTASTTDSTGVDRDAVPTTATQLPVQYPFSRLKARTVSGGPPKDGIPAIDDPAFVTATTADERLTAGDVVFGVARGNTAKAYPQHVLVWHEIVNDVVDGQAVSVTYCPLTGTAMGFERGETTFGVSGRLVNSNLVMYDRATDSRWPQMLATAIDGPLEGASLREFPVVWTTWDRWKTAYPDTRVLSEATGYARNYARDPYGAYNPPRGYYTTDTTLFAPLTRDDRFQTKTVVVGSRPPDGPLAVQKETLREQGFVEIDRADTTYLVVYDGALDTGYVYHNPDGRQFTVTEDGLDADETHYAPDALPLDRVLAFDAMWFAWAGFYPRSTVHA